MKVVISVGPYGIEILEKPKDVELEFHLDGRLWDESGEFKRRVFRREIKYPYANWQKLSTNEWPFILYQDFTTKKNRKRR